MGRLEELKKKKINIDKEIKELENRSYIIGCARCKGYEDYRIGIKPSPYTKTYRTIAYGRKEEIILKLDEIISSLNEMRNQISNDFENFNMNAELAEGNLWIGAKVKAIFPNGECEEGIVIKKDDRKYLDEGNHNIHAINGGFPDGTIFISEGQNE